MNIPTKEDDSGTGSDTQSNSRNQDNFFSRLKDRREDLKITQKDLGKLVGVSTNTIQSWEKDTHPKGADLIKLSDVLSCSIDWLLRGVDYCPKTQKEDKQQPGKEAQLQADLLRTIIRAIENELKQRDLELDPDKKAEAIALLYEMYADTKKRVTEKTIVRYLKLMA